MKPCAYKQTDTSNEASRKKVRILNLVFTKMSELCEKVFNQTVELVHVYFPSLSSDIDQILNSQKRLYISPFRDGQPWSVFVGKLEKMPML